MADRIPSTARRAAIPKRFRTIALGGPTSDLGELGLAISELWAFRDDCHIGAWEAASYAGPEIDTLTQIWTTPSDLSWATGGGITSLDELGKALHVRQDRGDVERSVEALARRGDVELDGDRLLLTPRGKARRDAIEDETDRRYFEIWQVDDAATARLGDDLRAVIDALPAGSDQASR